MGDKNRFLDTLWYRCTSHDSEYISIFFFEESNADRTKNMELRSMEGRVGSWQFYYSKAKQVSQKNFDNGEYTVGERN